MTVEWGDPPDIKTGRKAEPPAWTTDLKERPGDWGQIRTTHTQGAAAAMANKIRNGKYGDGFNAVSRRTSETTWGVWAVWTG